MSSRAEIVTAAEAVDLANNKAVAALHARDQAAEHLGRLLNVPDKDRRMIIIADQSFTIHRRGDRYWCCIHPVGLHLPF